MLLHYSCHDKHAIISLASSARQQHQARPVFDYLYACLRSKSQLSTNRLIGVIFTDSSCFSTTTDFYSDLSQQFPLCTFPDPNMLAQRHTSSPGESPLTQDLYSNHMQLSIALIVGDTRREGR